MWRIFKLTGLLLGLFLSSAAEFVKAGVVIRWTDGVQFAGKPTFNSDTIHVEGSQAMDIPVADVLEANFTDVPFHLRVFASRNDSSNDLPSDWVTQEIGKVEAPGSVSYASGAMTLTADKFNADADTDGMDHYLFVGVPWEGNGQWEARLRGMEPDGAIVKGGMMLRDTFDPSSAIIGIGPWDSNQGFTFARTDTHSTWQDTFDVDNFRDKTPIWFRIVRRGYTIELAVSSDGKAWNPVKNATFHLANNILVGFAIWHPTNTAEKITLDNIRFTPAPASNLPAGVILRGGSFLAGHFDRLTFDGSSSVESLVRGGASVPIPTAKVTTVVYNPVSLDRLYNLGSRLGVLMRNDDFMEATVEALSANGVTVTSQLFSETNLDLDQMSACAISPAEHPTGDYEVRLKDGSRLFAKSINVVDGKIAISDVSGLDLSFPFDEVMQLRAGPSRVETLLDLPWKTAQRGGGAPTASNQAIDVWTGSSQEQCMAIPAGENIEFPWGEEYDTLAFHLALSPDSPQNSQAVIRVLADGKEIASSPIARYGAPPMFLTVRMLGAKNLTFVADAGASAVKVLLIDPVAIRATHK